MKRSYHTFKMIFINRILDILQHNNRFWTHMKAMMREDCSSTMEELKCLVISKHQSFFGWSRFEKQKQKLRHLTASWTLSPERQLFLALDMTINAVSRRKTLCRVITLSSIPASHFLIAVMKPEAISRKCPLALHLNRLLGCMSNAARVFPISLSPIFSWLWRIRRPKSWKQ